MNENLPNIIVGEHSLQYVGPTSFFDLAVEEQISQGVVIANRLKDIIKTQGLFSVIGGKEYAKVEGWQVCGLFLKTHTREREVTRLDDGSYKACIDIVRDDSGAVVGNGSAICGKDEKRWANADEYARRSMAITRAIGKAYRSRFSWIVNLAGYESTPEEEMPTKEKESAKKVGDKSRDIKEELSEKNAKAYNDLDPDDIERLQTYFESNSDKIKPEHHLIIAQKLNGKPWYKLPAIAKEVTHAAR